MSKAMLSRRAFLKTALVTTVETALVGVGGFAYGHEIEPDWVAVQPVGLTLPRLSPAFDGYRVAQISDIHMDGWMNYTRLSHVVELVNHQRPDMVAITGDFVTDDAFVFADDIVAALRGLQAADGAVAVLGNHDHWTNARKVREIIGISGIHNVSNMVHPVRRGDEALYFAGIDDYWEGHARLDLVLKALPGSGAAILLAHEPDFADISAASGRFDLQLSGHSHGGQFSLPIFGPPVLPYLGKKYPSGRYQVGTMIQYTNRGVGMVEPKVRFNCRPEITVFTLQAP